MLLRISSAWEDLEIMHGLRTTNGNNTTTTFIRFPIKDSFKESDEGGTGRTLILISTSTMVSRARDNKTLRDLRQEESHRGHRTLIMLKDQYPILIPLTLSRS